MNGEMVSKSLLESASGIMSSMPERSIERQVPVRPKGLISIYKRNEKRWVLGSAKGLSYYFLNLLIVWLGSGHPRHEGNVCFRGKSQMECEMWEKLMCLWPDM